MSLRQHDMPWLFDHSLGSIAECRAKPVTKNTKKSKKELLNDKIKSIDAVEGFVHNKFRESRNKEGKLTFLDKKSEEEILFKLPLEEV